MGLISLGGAAKLWCHKTRNFHTCGIITSLVLSHHNFAAPSSEIKPILGYVRNLVKNTPTIFFVEKSGSFGTFLRFPVISEHQKWHHCKTFSDIRSKYFFEKKYVLISPRSGAHVGERSLFLSAIRRSYRRSKLAYLTKKRKLWRHLNHQQPHASLMRLCVRGARNRT